MPEWNNTGDLIANAREYFPALSRLFRGYFQDGWKRTHGTWEAAVDAFVRETSEAERADTRKELDELLSGVSDNVVLHDVLWSGLDCYFVPGAEDLTELEWLSAVRTQLSE